MDIMRGHVVWKFGDHFNSDLITQYPKYGTVSEPSQLAKICMIGFDPDFHKKVKKNDIILAGRNFGFGHPHAQAHQALQATGISCVVAESFAKAWFRTAVALGLPAFPCTGIVNLANVGDELQVDMKAGVVKNLTSGALLTSRPLPDFILDIADAKGLTSYLKAKLKSQRA